MKYVAPYGVADPDAPYINGNPSTGTAGSIPPAASLENPQREIVNLITDAGLVPSDNDLHQVAKGVQSGRLIYGDDIGAANQVSLAVQPPVTALTKGMQFITIFGHDNTGSSAASISGLPFVEIVHPTDRTPLLPLELRAGSVGCLAFDGNKFQLAWSNAVGSAPGVTGAPVFLTATLDYYVGGPGADDLNDGTTAAVSGIHGPFATLQKVMNTIANYNLNGHNINVHVFSPGTYDALGLGQMAGSGTVYWVGDIATPPNCVINGNGKSAVGAQNCGNNHSMQGFQVQSDGTYTNEPMCGFNVSGTGTSLQLLDISFGHCNGSHLGVTQAAVVSMGNKWIINGNARGANPGMTSGWHIYLGTNSIIQPNGGQLPILNINGIYGGLNGGGFVNCYALAFGEVWFNGMSGVSNWSGIKYQVQANAILTSHGGGASYYPGSVAGIAASGGQYF